MLESGDLNDATILAATTQLEDARGSIQFSVKLPSGRMLRSEFFPSDKRKEALYKWIEQVRQQAVVDARAERIAKAQAAMRAQIGPDLSSANGIPSSDTALVATTGQRAESPASGNTYNDPLEWARDRLAYYARTVEELKGQINVLSEELRSAEKKQGRWFMVVSSLTETENV